MKKRLVIAETIEGGTWRTREFPMKKWLLIALALAVFVVVPGISFWALYGHVEPGVTEVNFRRLHKGMTKNEIVAILGLPFGGEYRATWIGNGLEIHIAFGRRQNYAYALEHEPLRVISGSMTTADGRVFQLQNPKPLIEQVREFWGF